MAILISMARLKYFCFAAALVGCFSRDSGEVAAVSKSMPLGSPTASVPAAEAYNRGVRFREADKDRAVDAFSEAIELDPTFEAAIYNRALTYAELHRDQEAINDLAALKRLKSTQASTLEALLEAMPALYCHQGHKAIEKSDFVVAVEKFTAALLYAPDDPVILEWRAFAHESGGDEALANHDVNEAKAARARGIASIVVEDDNEDPRR
jgi:lipoprotein NlpI